MPLWPTTDVTITDDDVEDALYRTVRVLNPVLDVVGATDPLRLKRRVPSSSPDSGPDGGPIDLVADGIARALNAADLPGTLAWDDMDTDARIRWWVWRIGALNTVAVAYPGVLGIVGRLLPVQDLLGFVNQALVLCAVARELGVTEPRQQARMLAEVLCDRDTDEPHEPAGSAPSSLRTVVWRLPGVLDAVGDELAKRPQPRAPFRYLGMLPAVGAVASYFGECGALARAAKQGRRWITERFPEAVPGG
ncbi:hypothetical protein GCM10009645_08060 [Mycolicibacterium poriferae]|jgi:hypothetical protein|uniref:Uncharacterized protein n=1 Tax=Mycolicibacterium poriferae TaxID=39694 RepID=A0A6N4V4S3_9MYCO|nr:hypothetical protein [Mycolicibacterium poriferae]MCV7263968.1 hypothetical protein [Mycolicibacterium poriferae]BBX49895.1 hypothetical protein MPOR_09210 [Mycolicibacterium poriferae]